MAFQYVPAQDFYLQGLDYTINQPSAQGASYPSEKDMEQLLKLAVKGGAGAAIAAKKLSQFLMKMNSPEAPGKQLELSPEKDKPYGPNVPENFGEYSFQAAEENRPQYIPPSTFSLESGKSDPYSLGGINLFDYSLNPAGNQNAYVPPGQSGKGMAGTGGQLWSILENILKTGG